MAESTKSELVLQHSIVNAGSPTSPSTPNCISSLYVGDLEENVDEGQLFDLFNEVKRVHSVRICRNEENGVSFGYGYVNFTSSEDANIALRLLNSKRLNGKQIRIMFSDPDPTMRRSGIGNVYIKNLDSSIDNKELYEVFCVFGDVSTCKVVVDSRGRSKGFGYVQFQKEEDAKVAIRKLNGMLIKGKQVYVAKFIHQKERNEANKSLKFTNVYVKNFPETTTEEDFVQAFGKFGSITSAVIMRDMYGKSKCFGFVNFQDPKAATDAIEGLNNDGIGWYVRRAQKKTEREILELKANSDQDRKLQYEQMKEANLYIKNLDETITDDEKLKALFSPFGTITSYKIMFDSRGVSKGFGFVAFSTREEAKKAMVEMNRKMIGRKPLYISVAERKEERMARLQAQFAQPRASGLVTHLTTDKNRVHLGAPELQSRGYGLTDEPIMVGYGPSNFMAPVMCDGTPNQDLVNVFSGRNLMDNQMDQVLMGNNMVRLPFNVSTEVTSSSDVHLFGLIDTTKLASVLVSASPENQHQILRTYLYPLVEQIEHRNATSVTDMLLDMDNSEVLHLIESPNELKKKVGEAMALLISTLSCVANDDDHFGSLSLN
ncbi:hypothetical protein Lser_V15G00170 [Lactuca serriola]